MRCIRDKLLVPYIGEGLTLSVDWQERDVGHPLVHQHLLRIRIRGGSLSWELRGVERFTGCTTGDRLNQAKLTYAPSDSVISTPSTLPSAIHFMFWGSGRVDLSCEVSFKAKLSFMSTVFFFKRGQLIRPKNPLCAALGVSLSALGTRSPHNMTACTVPGARFYATVVWPSLT